MPIKRSMRPREVFAQAVRNWIKRYPHLASEPIEILGRRTSPRRVLEAIINRTGFGLQIVSVINFIAIRRFFSVPCAKRKKRRAVAK